MRDKILKKLSSRRFWMALIGFVGAFVLTCVYPDMSAEQATVIASGCAALASYIIGESVSDTLNKK